MPIYNFLGLYDAPAGPQTIIRVPRQIYVTSRQVRGCVLRVCTHSASVAP